MSTIPLITAEQLQHIEAHGAVFDLGTRAKWQLTGSDRVRYLNGQVTNDVRLATATEALYACVTDAKGRIVGDIHIHATDDALVFDAEPELRDILGPRLERYIISDDAELLDITDDWQLWHVMGAEALASLATTTFPEGTRRIANNRLGTPGIDVWLPVATQSSAAAMAPSPSIAAPATTYDALRILRRIPCYPSELADAFPPEAGIEARAMSYTKGCYIGQEVLSRIKTTGKMPRVLVSWQADAPILAGDEWFIDDARVGHATSVAFHPVLQRWAGLGYVKQGHAPLDSELLVRNAQPRIGPIVEISALLKQ